MQHLASTDAQMPDLYKQVAALPVSDFYLFIYFYQKHILWRGLYLLIGLSGALQTHFKAWILLYDAGLPNVLLHWSEIGVFLFGGAQVSLWGLQRFGLWLSKAVEHILDFKEMHKALDFSEGSKCTRLVWWTGGVW